MFRPDDEPDLVEPTHPSLDPWDPKILLSAKVEVVFDTLDILGEGDIEIMLAGWINAGLRAEQEEDEDWQDYDEYPPPSARLISLHYQGEPRPRFELSEKGIDIFAKDVVEQAEKILEEE